MIKGCATIQIFDENTGKVVRELHEENMITNAVDTILNPPDYIEIGMDSDNDRSFNMLRDFVGNIADTAFRGVIVCRDKIPEDGNNMMLPWTNEEIGHAGIANTNTDTSIGTYNANESGRIENGKGYRHVWDFASDKANGEISCICLTTKDGGTNGMHHSYWNLSCGGTDLNSSSLDSFKQAYHTIVGRYIPDSQFNCGVFKWFYMGRLTNGNVRLLGKHIHDGCIYEVVMFDPMSISVSAEKPFCGIISVKKVIELFPAAERIPNSTYDNSYHHGGYFMTVTLQMRTMYRRRKRRSYVRIGRTPPSGLRIFRTLSVIRYILLRPHAVISITIFSVCPTTRRFQRKPSKPTRCSKCMAWDLSMRESAILHRSTDGFTARV